MSNIIIMTFSPWNIVGCLLKKDLQRGGHGYPRTPPRYALGLVHSLYIPFPELGPVLGRNSITIVDDMAGTP